uniref:Uncharacterized protein n=1 Tax=Anguilla anguilla TaxID=7936 RepID=A0A0E9WB87_ANGAN
MDDMLSFRVHVENLVKKWKLKLGFMIEIRLVLILEAEKNLLRLP